MNGVIRPHRVFDPGRRAGTWQIDESDRARWSLPCAGPRPWHDSHGHGGDVRRLQVIVGEAIDGRRDEVFLVSRSFPRIPPDRDVGHASVHSRLSTDRLDRVLLHSHGQQRLEDTFIASNNLSAKGKTSLGVSSVSSRT